MANDQWTRRTNGAGGYADVNGITLYHEAHGRAGLRRLILLHGGLGSGKPSRSCPA